LTLLRSLDGKSVDATVKQGVLSSTFLIPNDTLEPDTEYTVIARGNHGEQHRWTFHSESSVEDVLRLLELRERPAFRIAADDVLNSLDSRWARAARNALDSAYFDSNSTVCQELLLRIGGCADLEDGRPLEWWTQELQSAKGVRGHRSLESVCRLLLRCAHRDAFGLLRPEKSGAVAEAVEAIRRMLLRTDELQDTAMNGLLLLGPAAVLYERDLHELMRSKRSIIRYSAILSLGTLSTWSTESIEVTLRALWDSDVDTAREAAKLLLRMPVPAETLAAEGARLSLSSQHSRRELGDLLTLRSR